MRDKADPDRKLQRALSYRDKARALLHGAQEGYAAGRIDEIRFEQLHQRCTDHLDHADRLIRKIREGQRQILRRVDKRRRALQREQARLIERLADGTLKNPKKVNRANRRIMTALERCDALAQDCNRLLAVENPKALGGFVDLPLEHYAAPVFAQYGLSVPAERAVALGMAGILALTILLPWLALGGGEAKPLYDIGPLLPRLGVPASPTVPPIRFLWIVYILGPVLAMPLIGMGTDRAVGLALIGVGALALGFVILPVVVLGFYAGGLGGLWTLICGLRTGAVAYGCLGAVLVAYGYYWSKQETPGQGLKGRRKLLGATVIAVLLGCAVVLGQSMPGGRSVTAVMSAMYPGFIEITCRNTGTEPVDVYVPWSEEPSARPAEPAYGMSVYLRERGQRAYRLFPASQACWTFEGMAHDQNRPFKMDPRRSLIIRLDLTCIKRAGNEVDMVRIIFSKAGGATIARFQAEVL